MCQTKIGSKRFKAMTKAKFLYKTINKDGDVEWWYEYRGRKYSIVPFKTEETLYQLHKNEQLNIDRQVELDEKVKQSTFKGEPAEKGFELFWKYLEE